MTDKTNQFQTRTPVEGEKPLHLEGGERNMTSETKQVRIIRPNYMPDGHLDLERWAHEGQTYVDAKYVRHIPIEKVFAGIILGKLPEREKPEWDCYDCNGGLHALLSYINETPKETSIFNGATSVVLHQGRGSMRCGSTGKELESLLKDTFGCTIKEI